MDPNTHPLTRMLLGAAILAAGLYVVYLIGMGKGGSWGCALTLLIIGGIFFLSGMLWYFWP
ncbi:MAG: hypothetical protein JOZ43_02265 [Acidobacteriales bacterium]|nr:hypothetical protein [Terriglobales bacterium]